MKSLALLPGAVLVLALWGQPVSAQPVQLGPPCCSNGDLTCPLLRGCPDDYCRKPYPCVWQMHWCGPDDYCRKPFPCIWQMHWCGPDDYCRKPCPPACRPLDTSYYTCGCPCQDPAPVHAEVHAEPNAVAPAQPEAGGTVPAQIGPPRELGAVSPYHQQGPASGGRASPDTPQQPRD
jgi:hypothetical protein